MSFPKLDPKPYRRSVYRNIFTNVGEHILSDIVGESEYEIVNQAMALSSGIDHSLPQIYRPFQYGKVENDDILAVFKRQNWSYGRFGDGKEFGVWYGAEEELTSVYEACWVATRIAADNTKFHGEVYTTDRMMYHAKVVSEKSVDLVRQATRDSKNFRSLIHPRDYSFCQTLGEKMYENGLELLRTPSARKQEGRCVPLFSPAPIRGAEKSYYLKIHVNPDQSINVSSSRQALNFTLQTADIIDPYGVMG